jgi:arabinofuranosyltransferase
MKATTTTEAAERTTPAAPPIINVKPAMLILGISILVMLLLAWLYHSLLSDVYDDAYISFRYAANLIHGNGLVYNPGEYVEGYTNFLWVLTSALAMWLGLDPGLTTYVLNGLFGVGLLLLVGWFGTRLAAWGRITPGWQSLAIFALASSSPLIFAMISGLETALFTLLLTAAVFSYVLEQRGGRWLPLSGILFALATLARPEGVLFWGLTVLYQLVALRRTPSPISGESKGRGSSLLWLIGSFLIIWLPYMVWKVSYYGSVFPNTFYDKATSNSSQLAFGIGYVLSAWPYLFGPLAFALALAALLRRGRLGFIEGYFTLLITVNFAYVAYVGGDYMEAYRFLLPTFPLLSLLIAASAEPLYHSVISHQPTEIVKWLLIAVFAVLGVSSCFISGDTNSLSADGEYNRNSVAVIDWLRTSARPGDVLALETVGKIPYYTGLYTIDMLGLTDAHIAHTAMESSTFIPGHNKTDAAYILSRKPAYILIYHSPASASVSRAYLPGSMAMVNNKDFVNNYVKAAVFALFPGVEGWIYKHRLGALATRTRRFVIIAAG